MRREEKIHENAQFARIVRVVHPPWSCSMGTELSLCGR